MGLNQAVLRSSHSIAQHHKQKVCLPLSFMLAVHASAVSDDSWQWETMVTNVMLTAL